MGQIFTIAPHAPFLPTLAQCVQEGRLPRGSGPFGLADLTIFLPTRRARAALAEAFLDLSGPATLLPDLRTLGEVDEEEEPFIPPYPAPQIRPVVSAQRRRLVLGQLIEGWIEARGAAAFASPGVDGTALPPNARDILGLADALAGLIDDCLIEQVPYSALLQLDMGDLAGNWQEGLDFLRIALEHWPAICGARGEIDPALARNERLERQAEAIPLIYGNRPVIIAGSTGSMPATAKLIAAIARLPDGAVVLPGLDTQLSARQHDALLDDGRNPHGHPQYGLMRLLRHLGSGPGAVQELARPQTHARTQMVRWALAAAEETANWPGQRTQLFAANGAKAKADLAHELAHELAPDLAEDLARDLTLVGARSDEEQARAIAIAARDALTEGKKVGIVTPDRVLARRIAAELARFEVQVDDSAGTPLYQTLMGRLARQAIAVVAGRWRAVDLMGLLRNQAVHLGYADSELRMQADLLEMAVLRGQRPAHGPDGLRRVAQKNFEGGLARPHLRLDGEKLAAVLSLIDTLEQALMPLSNLFEEEGRKEAAGLAEALAQTCTPLLAGRPAATSVQGESEFNHWADALGAQPGIGPAIDARDLSAALYALMAGATVRPPVAARTDIAILGLIEARLLSFDVTILCGLNEGVWPEIADPGPWLSRAMAIASGLAPPEKRHGQVAHDFQMALGGPEVLLCWSQRKAGAPADPSRLIQRLTAFMGTKLSARLKQKGAFWCDQARRLDLAERVTPAPRPQPKPPARVRPRTLSVTEIETLIRSPYDLYARHVLKLRPLEPLGHDPDFAERGTLVHDILAQFIENGGDPCAPDGFERLMQEAEAVFASLETAPSRRAGWRRRFAAQATAFLRFERARASDIDTRHVERWGELALKIAGTDFTLRGRADRIDVMRDGGLEILDYKTGGVPDAATMRALLAPQLLVEAKMAELGAFEGIAPAKTAKLTYLKLAFGPEALQVCPLAVPKNMEIGDAIARTFENLQSHMQAYLVSDRAPMLPHLLPDPKARYAGDYDHLARVEEWALLLFEEGE